MYTIFAAVPVTRRISLCYVISADNVVRFSHKHLSTCLLWLIDQGETACRIDNGEKVVRVTLSPENLTPAMLDGLTEAEVDQVRALLVENRHSPEDAIKRVLDARQGSLLDHPAIPPWV